MHRTHTRTKQAGKGLADDGALAPAKKRVEREGDVK